MRSQWTAALLATGLLVWACGCDVSQQSRAAGSNRPEPVPELVGQARPPVADLPVPLGFKLDQGRSRSFATGGVRWVDHVYKGSADKFAVARFYKRNMPISKWELMTDMFVQGKIILTFEKPGEASRVEIRDGDLFHSTYIETALWTKGQMAAPPARD
jgi:hypothetical protein